jgi:hypothetical protein
MASFTTRCLVCCEAAEFRLMPVIGSPAVVTPTLTPTWAHVRLFLFVIPKGLSNLLIGDFRFFSGNRWLVLVAHTCTIQLSCLNPTHPLPSQLQEFQKDSPASTLERPRIAVNWGSGVQEWIGQESNLLQAVAAQEIQRQTPPSTDPCGQSLAPAQSIGHPMAPSPSCWLVIAVVPP